MRGVTQAYLLGGLLAGLLGCGSVAADSDASSADAAAGGADAATGADAAEAPSFSLRVIDPEVSAPLAGQNSFLVEVERKGGFTGAVTLSADNVPGGLSITAETLAAGETTIDVTLGAAAPLTIGAVVTFDLVGTAGGVADQTVTVSNVGITGKPGTADTTFGPLGTGLAAVSFGADDYGTFRSVSLNGAGAIVLTGDGVGGLGAIRMATIRLSPQGAVDSGWNGGAMVRSSFGGSSGQVAQAFGGGFQLDGHFVAIGWAQPGAVAEVALVRFSTGGVSDGDFSFGNQAAGGKALFDGGSNSDDRINDGLVLPDGKIIAVGSAGGKLSVTRTTQLGVPDTSFDGDGFLIQTLGTSSVANAVVLDGSGRLLVAGTVTTASGTDVVLLRIGENGMLDATFGPGGMVTVGTPVVDESPVAIAVLGDGRIVVAGNSNASGANDIELRKFLADGTPDASFGTAGVARTPTGASLPLTDMALQPNGRIVAVGTSATGPFVARFTRTGAPDLLFDGDGLVTLPVGDNGEFHAIRFVDSHRALISGGNSGGVPGPGTFGIVLRMWL